MSAYDKRQILDLSDCKNILQTTKLGRYCTKCRTFCDWESYDKKSNGINGRDSRCKKCIAIIKMKKAKEKRRERLREEKVTSKFKSESFGYLDNHAIDHFSSIFSESIIGLIDDGRI